MTPFDAQLAQMQALMAQGVPEAEAWAQVQQQANSGPGFTGMARDIAYDVGRGALSSLGGAIADGVGAVVSPVVDGFKGAAQGLKEKGYAASGMPGSYQQAFGPPAAPQQPPEAAPAPGVLSQPPPAAEAPQAGVLAQESVQPPAAPPQPALQQTPRPVDPKTGGDAGTDYMRGQVTSRYESGGSYTAINPQDTGGAAYGKSQIHSNNIPAFASKYAPGVFDDVKPGTPEFAQRWKEWGDTPAGRQAQEQYIADTHFDPLANKLKGIGIDYTQRSPGVEELIHSTSVQFGPNNMVFEKALAGKDVANMSDEDIIRTVNQYKIDNVETLFKSSPPGVRRDVASRFNREMQDHLNLVGTERGVAGTPGAAPGGDISPGILSQTQQAQAGQQPVTQQQGAEMERPKGKRESAEEFYDRIHSNPWKAGLYYGLAALAEVDPHKHLQLLQDMDANDAQEAWDFQKLEIERMKASGQGTGSIGPGIKAQTWQPEANGWQTLLDDGTSRFVPSPSEKPTSNAATEEMRQGQVELARVDAETKEMEQLIAEGEKLGLLQWFPNAYFPKLADKAAEDWFKDPEAYEKNQWRFNVERMAGSDAISRLADLVGATTDREFIWMRDLSPKVGQSKSSFDSYIRMRKLFLEKIRARVSGGLTAEQLADFDARRQDIEDQYKLDEFLQRD